MRAPRLWACAIGTAAALAMPRPAASNDEFGPRIPASRIMFGSLEAGPTKSFAVIGMKRALGGAGLDASGFRTIMTIGASREVARRQPPRGVVDKAHAQTLVGYEWRIGTTFLALYAGLDYRACECAALGAMRPGQRIQADLWMSPTQATTVQASLSAAPRDGEIWGRLAAGWSPKWHGVLRDARIGPEVEAYRERGYRKLRLGLHLSGLRLLGLTWRVSGGWQRTSDTAAEAYAILGLDWSR